MLNVFSEFIIDVLIRFVNNEIGFIIGGTCIVCCSFGIVKRLWSKF